MPFVGLAVLLLQVTFLVHAVRTGRPWYWMTIIMMLPVAGCIAYFIAEMLPEMRHSRAARDIANKATQVIAPDREYNRLREAVEDMPTADNKRALAEELIRRGDAAEAERLFQSALTPPHDNDPTLLIGLAQAQFLLGKPDQTLAQLDRVQEISPGYKSHAAHLLYARALEGAGRTDEALAEYAALATVFPGEEAKVRYACLLQQTGDHARARELLNTVLRNIQRGSRHYRAEQQEWHELAQRRLGP